MRFDDLSFDFFRRVFDGSVRGVFDLCLGFCRSHVVWIRMDNHHSRRRRTRADVRGAAGRLSQLDDARVSRECNASTQRMSVRISLCSRRRDDDWSGEHRCVALCRASCVVRRAVSVGILGTTFR